MLGYANSVLHVDLSRLVAEPRELNRDTALAFIGGSGLAAKILYDETDGSTDPLGPENVLIFMTGPYAGTRALSSSRHVVVAKSPLTGLFGEANSGGSWAEALKLSGCDGLVITGRAAAPTYLWIHDGEVVFRPAAHIWGQDTFATDTAVKAETAETAVVACIGPAGERLIPFSVILNDGVHARTASRCGLGAVMGSKNLKAIAVAGTLKFPIYDSEGLARSVRAVAKEVVTATVGLKAFGTGGALAGSEARGGLPVKNWGYPGRWEEGADKITGVTVLQTYKSGNYHCKRCIISCGQKVKVPGGPSEGEELAFPEYESLALLGSNCLVDDPVALIRANDLCNRYGLDTMSTGGVIAFGMEAFERGLIGPQDTGGIDLRWGSAEALIQTIHSIARQTGIGTLLGRGTRAAAAALGKNAEEFAIHVKGLEFPAHDPRAYNAGGVNLATSSIGASHQAGFSHAFERNLSAPEIGIPRPVDPFEVEGKGVLAAKTQDYMGMVDSLITCKFVMFGGVGISAMIDWYQRITGVSMNVDEFMRTGERIFNIKRLYNTRCGVSRKDDTLPPRILTWAKTGEEHSPNLPHLGKMLCEYYRYRGWSEDGIPTPERLESLEIVPREDSRPLCS
jgi:aldehyde:ferredoxin oxidoreductase